MRSERVHYNPRKAFIRKNWYIPYFSVFKKLLNVSNYVMTDRQSMHNRHSKLFLENIIDFILHCVVYRDTPPTNIGGLTAERLSSENYFENIEHFFLTYRMLEA